jgi:hypothetical protein
MERKVEVLRIEVIVDRYGLFFKFHIKKFSGQVAWLSQVLKIQNCSHHPTFRKGRNCRVHTQILHIKNTRQSFQNKLSAGLFSIKLLFMKLCFHDTLA